MARDLPSGTVTFLFADIEGSTRLLHELGAEAYGRALAKHRRLLREAFGRHGGVEVDTQGDANFAAFPTASGALRAAAQARDRLAAAGPIRVRMGIHTGAPHLTPEGYVGPDVHKGARICAIGHGGQVLVSATTAALVGTDGIRDLGEHRLKDLSAPERIYQLGTDDFPPLRSLHQTNLPIPSTPFLGREQELAEVVGLLSRQNVRLLTLTGPGGTGKTRLALQAAGGVADRYPHGVWWVPLAALRDPRLVLATAEQAVGTTDRLADHIADRSMLLLLDNFEQVVEAGADVAGLLAACPGLELLVTSREPLHISGEQEYPVPPLAQAEGIELFLARARAAKPDVEIEDAMSEICRRLENLPLAIELAAARVKVLSSQQILARLEQRLPLLTGGPRDLPERQRTLRGAIAWSYELLTPDEQRLLARIAVFRGGWTLDAAEEVAEADLDLLQSLVDKSLVRHREERFSMLETIREYAVERLDASGEAEELRRRHADHFLALAEKAEPELRGDSQDWLDRLEREHDNLRAALDRLQAAGETERVLRLAGAASRFWYLKSHLTEGQRRLESALGAEGRPTAARAKALNAAAVMAINLGDSATARLRAEEALALHRTLGDEWGTTYSLMMVGNARAEGGDAASAHPLLAESVRRFRDLGDEHYALVANLNVAWVTAALGDSHRSRSLQEDNLRLARQLGNERLEASALAQLAMLACDEDRLEDASAMLRDAIRIHYRDVNDLDLAYLLGRLASVLALDGRAAIAARLLGSSASLAEQVGARAAWWADDRIARTLATVHRQLDEAAFDHDWNQGRGLTVAEAVALALGPVD